MMSEDATNYDLAGETVRSASCDDSPQATTVLDRLVRADSPFGEAYVGTSHVEGQVGRGRVNTGVGAPPTSLCTAVPRSLLAASD